LNAGRRVDGFNRFVFDREMGDGWNHARPVNTSLLIESSLGAQVKVALDSDVKTVVEISRRYRLPRSLRYSASMLGRYTGAEETEEEVDLTLVTRVTLERDSPYVKVNTRFFNAANDYRLRLKVPTGLSGPYFASQSFYFLERPEGRLTGDATLAYREFDPPEKNFSGVAGKRDGNGGMAFIARYGLKEISAADGNLYVTLLRSFGRTPQTNGEPEAQNPGWQEYEYAYTLFGAQTDCLQLHNFSVQYRSKLLSHFVRASGDIARCENRSLLSLSGEAAFSAMTPTWDREKDALLLRVVNSSRTEAKFRVGSEFTMRSAVVVDFRETAVRSLEVRANQIAATLRPWEILTMKITFDDVHS